MARIDREYHPACVAYQEFIASHSNYEGMPAKQLENGSVKWVAAGSSALGKKRKDWWLNKKAEFVARKIKIPAHAELSPVALLNHPTKVKPCQICGRIMSLKYIYPTKNTLKYINDNSMSSFYEGNFQTIFEIIDILTDLDGDVALRLLGCVFPDVLNVKNITKATNIIRKNYVEKFSKKLSPGAMSNCPDRFDGFHSYNKCCRGQHDLGRHQTNLSRYGEDRRAYEYWADGDWKAANWLMKKFNRHGLSADHVGPISLGFSHRPSFQPMSVAENSSKGNRMSFDDFKKLLHDESSGENIVSWHSKPIWNTLKKHVQNEADVLRLCKCMRKNLHNILLIFAKLDEDGMEEFLKSILNPDYAFYSIEFVGFDVGTGAYRDMKKTKGSRAEYTKNAERYVRIAFEAIRKYQGKENRHHQKLSDDFLNQCSKEVSSEIKNKGTKAAKRKLLKFFANLANSAESEFLS